MIKNTIYQIERPVITYLQDPTTGYKVGVNASGDLKVSITSVSSGTIATTAKITDTAGGTITATGGALHVAVQSSTLPTGASTAANQATQIGHAVSSNSLLVNLLAGQVTSNSFLAVIAGDTTSLDGKVTACNTGAVVISSSALPTGAATAAHQVSANSVLSTISGNLITCNTGAVTIAASALPTGAATAAHQVSANSIMNIIAGDTTSLDGKVTKSDTDDVIVTSNLIPFKFDNISLTYSSSGLLATAVYKVSSSTVATLTMSYDGSENLTAVVRT